MTDLRAQPPDRFVADTGLALSNGARNLALVPHEPFGRFRLSEAAWWARPMVDVFV
jgi:hypothetical protein